jgi:hypothetical protein
MTGKEREYKEEASKTKAEVAAVREQLISARLEQQVSERQRDLLPAEKEEQAELEQLLLKSEGVIMEIERKVSDLQGATMAQMAGLELGERALTAKIDSLADELILTKAVMEDDKRRLESKIAVLEEEVLNSKEMQRMWWE